MLYRQVDIEAYEESCLATSTKTVAAQVSAGRAMFRFVGRCRQAPTIYNVAAPAATWASQLSGQLKARSPQARTDQAGC